MARRATDFRESTIKILAARAGYQCSHPTCERPTIGPGKGLHDINRSGEASHIYGASAGGPRYKQMSLEEIRALSNGIWLCKDHAKLIDNRDGEDYSAHLLQTWKAAHEARMAIRQTGDQIPFTWLARVILDEAVDSALLLTANTALRAQSGMESDEILSRILAPAFPEYLRGPNFKIELQVFSPEPETISFSWCGGALRGERGGAIVEFLAYPLEVLRPNASYALSRGDGLGQLSGMFGQSERMIRSIVRHFSHLALPNLKSMEVRDDQFDDNDYRLPAAVYGERGNGQWVRLEDMSASEQAVVVIGLATILARGKIGQVAVLVAIDSGIAGLLEEKDLQVVQNLLAQSRAGVQTLLSVGGNWADAEGWTTVDLS